MYSLNTGSKGSWEFKSKTPACPHGASNPTFFLFLTAWHPGSSGAQIGARGSSPTQLLGTRWETVVCLSRGWSDLPHWMNTCVRVCIPTLGWGCSRRGGLKDVNRRQEAKLKTHLLFHVIISIFPRCNKTFLSLFPHASIPEVALGSGGGKGKGSEVLQTWIQMLAV